MSLSTDVGLQLIVSEAQFALVVAQLNTQIITLQDYRNQYERMKDRLDDCFRTGSGESDKYKESIQEHIDNIDAALATTRDVFASYGRLSENLDRTITNVGNIANEAITKASELFK